MIITKKTNQISIGVNKTPIEVDKIMKTKLVMQKGYFDQGKFPVTLNAWINILKKSKETKKEEGWKLFPQLNAEKDDFSGIVCLDFDKPDNINEILEKLKQNTTIFAGGTSISKKGVWAFAVIQKTQDKEINKEIYIETKRYFEKLFNETIDPMMSSNKFGRTESPDNGNLFVKTHFNILTATITQKIEQIYINELKTGKNEEKYVEKVIKAIINTEEGKRHTTLINAIALLFAKVRENGFNKDYVKDQLFWAAKQMNFNEKEAKRLIEWGK